MKYISSEDVCTFIKVLRQHTFKDDYGAKLLATFIEEYIKNESDKIIRCKNCKYWQTENKPNSKSDYRLCVYYRGYKAPDGFCDLGERKDDEA